MSKPRCDCAGCADGAGCPGCSLQQGAALHQQPRRPALVRRSNRAWHLLDMCQSCARASLPICLPRGEAQKGLQGVSNIGTPHHLHHFDASIDDGFYWCVSHSTASVLVCSVNLQVRACTFLPAGRQLGMLCIPLSGSAVCPVRLFQYMQNSLGLPEEKKKKKARPLLK